MILKRSSGLVIPFIFSVIFFSCRDEEAPGVEPGLLQLSSVKVGDTSLRLEAEVEEVPMDQPIMARFAMEVKQEGIEDKVHLRKAGGERVDLQLQMQDNGKTVSALPAGLEPHTSYQLEIDSLASASGNYLFPGARFTFTTRQQNIMIVSAIIDEQDLAQPGRVQEVNTKFQLKIIFSEELQEGLLDFSSIRLRNNSGNIPLQYELSDPYTLLIEPKEVVPDISRYTFSISQKFGENLGYQFNGFTKNFYTRIEEEPKFPLLSTEELLTLVQRHTFSYFWEYAHPESGMARERLNSGDLVTIGGSGFGVMAILVGIERGFISRQQGVDRLAKVLSFLEKADRFHGVWPHWLNGSTGKTIPFSQKDDGGDLVETSFMIQGLLTVRQYLNPSDVEEAALIAKINRLWEEVEWNWYTKGGEEVLYWHWSPNYGWEMNHPVRGYNEALITYVLAAASPTHPIEPEVYHQGWARSGAIQNKQEFYNLQLPLGPDYGGPLFFAHYSFLGLDPRNLEDRYANYWEQNVNHTLINRAYSIENPRDFVGYGENNWGLTASDNQNGYSAHSPTNDLGVITPTAALSSIPYTPEYSVDALEHFYYRLGDRLWGEYGFYDAFNLTEDWTAGSYLAIDQGPIIIMIENYRSALLWDLFMSSPEIQEALPELGFNSY